MKYSPVLAALVAAPSVLANNGTSTNTTSVLTPGLAPGADPYDSANVVPQANVSLYYGSNSTPTASINVQNAMKYPTVLLEQIASITSVNCSVDSVVMIFNDPAVFASTQAVWIADGTMVFITNHLGDCDTELERGFFLSSSLSFNNSTLVATASSVMSDISSTAVTSEITFGNLPTADLTKRDLNTTLVSDYTISPAIALPADTLLYSYAPYLTVTADQGYFDSTLTLSGYLLWDWFTFSVDALYFDFDVEFSSALEITADVAAAFNKTFSYTPATLFYGYTVPGIITIGPELIFAVDANVYASGETNLTVEVQVGLADGNVHVDLLHESKTGTSGWVPTYNASATISGAAEAQINPSVSLTVEIALTLFDDLISLSTGLTAKPGFTNTFILTGAAGVDLTGYEDLTSSGTCENGLAIDSEFVFSVEAFATEWYETTLYEVEVPLLHECYLYAS